VKTQNPYVRAAHKKGISQQELSRVTGLSPTTINKFFRENYDFSNTRINTHQKLADELGLSVTLRVGRDAVLGG
jgi:transcriptional regulator with XRE-family HTH domain